MGTSPPTLTTDKRADWQRKVSDPLERLRGYIRLYVSIEGAAVLLLYMALWFWIGLALDYGFFKLFTVDWVQILHWRVRAAALVILVSGLLALLVGKVTLRLLREFSDPALALVLERRFPKLLGDRLITAVELADPHKSARYGFSQVMIDQTVQDAAERVGQVPVSEAFNWKRLRRYLALVVGLTLGLFLLCGAGYWALAALPEEPENPTRAKDPSFGGFTTDFANVAAIWFERNILLENTIWPRRVYLELVGFPESGELRVGKNVGAAPVRVRALKWVIADKKSPEGWRQLKWSELKDGRLLGDSVVFVPLPTAFFPDRDGQEWTVDAVDSMTDRDDVRQKMNQAKGGLHGSLRDVIDQLKVVAAHPSMSRTLRQLEIPNDVTATYKGDTTQSEQTLKREENNEYAGTLSDLKETVRFWVCAMDYCTKQRTIAVVPPPTLQELTREEAQPAYLYYRVPRGGTAQDLVGRKQHLAPEIDRCTGDTSRIDLPSGTDLKLVGRTYSETSPSGEKKEPSDKDKVLAQVVILPRNLAEFQKTLSEQQKKRPPAEVWQEVNRIGAIRLVGDTPRTFEVEIKNITNRLDFDFEMTDTDNVVARRHVIVQPAEDVPPEVEVAPVIVRKTAEGYMVTASAKIPFEGRLRDDHGLSRVQYHYGYTALQERSVIEERAIRAALIMQITPMGIGGNPLLVPAFAAPVVALMGRDERERSGDVPMDSFKLALRADASWEVTLDQLNKRLHEKPRDGHLVRRHEISPRLVRKGAINELDEMASEGFDLQASLPELKISGTNQGRYKLRLSVTATDNNVEAKPEPDRPTGGRTAESKETFTFVVVSEAELLGAIAKEEAELYDKLKTQALGKLEIYRYRLGQVESYLKASDFNSAEYGAHAERSLQVAEGISAASVTAREVHDEYVRIYNELKANRVGGNSLNKTSSIIEPLKQAIDNDFPQAEEAQRKLQQALDKAQKEPAEAKRVPALLQTAVVRMDELIARLNQVVDAMGQLNQLNDQINRLREIHKEQQEVVARLRFLAKKIEDLLFGE